ncbi:spore germination protein GerKA [Bacillus nakamurai]|uniref:spore germination protein GerKA n=1 Tax=Bacillus nakamurai TaxID=1793963 RepID=UPI001E62387E|nr:spore germination protein [Bacillus nakamurai]MCC9023444.1 spore germination protein [Bacillus nakamurai]
MPPFFKQKKKKNTEKQNRQNGDKKEEENKSEEEQNEPISASLSENMKKLSERFGNSADVVIRRLKIGKEELPAAIVYIAGLVDEQLVSQSLLEDLIDIPSVQPEQAICRMYEKTIAVGGMKEEQKWKSLYAGLMAGSTLIFVDGADKALIASTEGGERRSIEEPSTQVSFRGPRQGFTESLQTNVSMIRRYIKTPDVWVEKMKIGHETNTDVALMYINGLCEKKLIKEVRSRLKHIDIDSILESGYIEQLIEDEPFSVFPTVYHTERPDVVAGNLLEGRFAIIVDGTPFVLLAPALFIQFFQSVEDYYSRFDIATSIRMLRVLIFFISLVAPGIYVAATTFHQEMIPTQLLIVIAAQRETVPFPAVIEALTMEVAFEILREAGVRLPRVVGSAVSIVGALVIGQAAVQAGIVSPAMVIVVALTAIASFATPAFDMAISARLIRFVFILSAAVMGFYGLILDIIIMFVHLCSLRSFGFPYMSPLAPMSSGALKDSIFRAPLWAGEKRPGLLVQRNNRRQGRNQMPKPETSRGMVNKDIKEGDGNEKT